MTIDTLHKLFLHELKDAYSAEQQLIKALPKIASNAVDSGLKELLEDHLEETKGHAIRLEKIFKMLDHAPQAQLCRGMQGILLEGEEGMKQTKPEMMDMVITGSAQRVEHYEAAAYKGLLEMAETLGHDKAAELLMETWKEEITASNNLETAAKAAIAIVPIGHDK